MESLKEMCEATERVDLRKSAVVVGDIFSQRIAIEDGAYFKGKVDIQKETPKSRTPGFSKPETARFRRRKWPERPPSSVATAAVAAASSGASTAPGTTKLR